MINWKKFASIEIFKKLRLKSSAVIERENANGSVSTVSLAELDVLDGVTAGTVTASKAVVVDANKDISAFRDVTARKLIGTTDPLNVNGLAAAQGGAATIAGGTSSTAANAGGAGKLVGGLAGATGTGGAAQVTGGAGGAASGVGGAAQVAGGAGTAGNSAGGVASITGGAGQGSAAGGIGKTVGGASGVGATGNGGAAQVTGGAAASTNGQGGDVTLTPGAGVGTGFSGNLVEASALKLVKQAAPTALTTSVTLTAAQILVGLLTANQGANGVASYTLPTGTEFEAGFSSFATDQAFDFSLVNISTVAAEDVDILADAGWTLVGSMAVQSNDAITSKSVGRFRARRTAANTFVLYRIG